MRSGAGLAFPRQHAVGALHQVGDQPGLPGSPGRGPGGPAVGFGQGTEQMQRHPVADRLGDRGDGGGIVEVAPGGRVGQEQVEAHHVDQDGHIVRVEAHASSDTVDDLDADRGVVARKALADVVQQRADQQEVGSFDPVGQLGRQGGGLKEVTVDRVGVIGVALRLVAHCRPLGDQADEQPVLVERLDLVDGGPAGPAGRPGRPGSRADHGSPGGGMRSARRYSEALAMGRSSRAAVAARRKASDASSDTAARGVRAISPSTSTISGRSSGTGSWRWSGVVRRKRRLGAGWGPTDAAAARRRH